MYDRSKHANQSDPSRKKTSPAKPAPGPAQRAHPAANRLHFLQRYAGNQATARLMRDEGEPQAARPLENSHPAGVRSEDGQPLDSRVRARMEGAFGQDFSGVRVHTDAKAASQSNRLSARAFTVGRRVSFGEGQYQPGTLMGDALIAHELAHVVQQQATQRDVHGAQDVDGARAPGRDRGAREPLERDANRSALGVLSTMWQGAKQAVAGLALQGRPALRTGLRLQRCSKTERLEPPSYLGPHSRATLERINEIIEAGGLLQDTVTYGPLIVILTGPPSVPPLEEQVRAAQAVPAIVKNRVIQQIQFLYLDHGNELTQDEKAYWDRLLDLMNR